MSAFPSSEQQVAILQNHSDKEKQLVSPILFGLSKVSINGVVPNSLFSRKIYPWQIFRQAGSGLALENIFQNYLMILEEWIDLQNYW